MLVSTIAAMVPSTLALAEVAHLLGVHVREVTFCMESAGCRIVFMYRSCILPHSLACALSRHGGLADL